MVKFCENIVLVIIHDSNRIIPYPPHKKKKAEEDIKYKFSGKGDILIVKNKGFSLKFSGIFGKYWGSNVILYIDHPEIDKTKYKKPHEPLYMTVSTVTFSKLLETDTLFGGKFLGTYSIDAMNNTYELIQDCHPDIPKRMEEYNRYYGNTKTTSLKAGGIYVNQHGHHYLSVSDAVYSRVIGSGWSYEGYGLSRTRCATRYPFPKKVSVLLYLGDNWETVRNYIIDPTFNVWDFIRETILRKKEIHEINHSGSVSIDSEGDIMKYDTILRIKNYYSGEFVKLGEINSVKSQCSGPGNWIKTKKFLENIIFDSLSFDPKIGLYRNNSLNPVAYSPLLCILEKAEEGIFLDEMEKDRFKDLVIFQIEKLRLEENWSLKKNFPEFYTPPIDGSMPDPQDDLINHVFHLSDNLLKATPGGEWKDLIDLGVFKDKSELIQIFKEIMYGES